MNSNYVSIFTIFFVVSAASSNTVENKCTHIRYPNFKLSVNLSLSTCAVCRQGMRLRFLKLIPYSDKGAAANQKIIEVFRSCCTLCGGFKIRWESFFPWQPNPSSIRKALLNNDVVYPILAYSKSSQVYGGYFIPFYNPSGAIYIARKEEFRFDIMLTSCAQLWPLLVVGISMVMIAGFVGWILDTWANKEEFPTDFMRGWWEGIWWSFVTMTTVGYGDKAPRSVPARLFAIVWIYAGIVLCGILTASLTTIIIESTTEKTPSMNEAKVGVLPNRMYDDHLIVNNGGASYPSAFCWEVTSSIFYMLDRLKKGDIDGFLLDRSTYWKWQSLSKHDPETFVKYYKKLNATTCDKVIELEKEVVKRKLNNKKMKNTLWHIRRHKHCFPLRYQVCREGLLQYFMDRTKQVNIPHSGDEMAYGIWMKNHSYYTFFHDAFMNNQISIKSELAKENMEKREKSRVEIPVITLFSKLKNHPNLFIANGVALGSVVLFGVIYELAKKGMFFVKRRTSQENTSLTCHHLK